MPESRPGALPMLAGVAFVVLAVAAFVTGGETPSFDDSAQKVVSFYDDNKAREYVASFLIAYATLFGAIFVGHVHAVLRWASPRRGWTTVAAIGGGGLVAGWLVAAGVHLAVTEAVDKDLPDDAVRALNALDTDIWPALAVPLFVVVLATAAALLAADVVPRWLAWVGLALGILGFTPAAFFVFLLCGVWVLVFSVLAYLRLSAAEDDRPPPVAAAPA